MQDQIVSKGTVIVTLAQAIDVVVHTAFMMCAVFGFSMTIATAGTGPYMFGYHSLAVLIGCLVGATSTPLLLSVCYQTRVAAAFLEWSRKSLFFDPPPARQAWALLLFFSWLWTNGILFTGIFFAHHIPEYLVSRYEVAGLSTNQFSVMLQCAIMAIIVPLLLIEYRVDNKDNNSWINTVVAHYDVGWPKMLLMSWTGTWIFLTLCSLGYRFH